MTVDANTWQHDYAAIITAGTSKSTRRAYRRDAAYFHKWIEATTGQSTQYPVSEEVVIRFILDHIGQMDPVLETQLIEEGSKRKLGPLTIPTLRRYLASISIAHQEAGHDSPTQTPKVKILLRRAKRAMADYKPNKKAAITKTILEAMLSTCDDSLTGTRDRALLLLGFTSGGRRRDEIAHLLIDDLRKVDEGYILTVRRSKTDQTGRGFEVPVIGVAAVALREWLVKSGLRSGKLFRGIRNTGKLNDGISGSTISRIVKRRVALAGYDPSQFSGHSLRSGFITEAARSGANLGDAMALSGHRCAEVASGYYREAMVLENPAGKLFIK